MVSLRNRAAKVSGLPLTIDRLVQEFQCTGVSPKSRVWRPRMPKGCPRRVHLIGPTSACRVLYLLSRHTWRWRLRPYRVSTKRRTKKQSRSRFPRQWPRIGQPRSGSYLESFLERFRRETSASFARRPARIRGGICDAPEATACTAIRPPLRPRRFRG